MNENVTVCITPKGEKPVLHFSQFDNERVFTVTVLADDGESAAVLTGLDIEFRIRKTDSHVVTIAPESVADNVITFKTTEQLCACCGQNIASVVLMKDDMIISTLDIIVDIQRDILSGGLTSESDIRNLTTQIEQIVPEVIGDDYYNKQEVDDLLAEHTFDPTNYYNKSDVDGLLADKADADDVYTKSDVDGLLAAKMDNIGYHGVVDDASVISFTTDCNAPLDIIKGNITPVQSGTGTPSPQNVRPISGFSALNVTLADGDMQTVDTATVNFGQTVYGGVADVTNGKVIITHEYCVLNGTETITSNQQGGHTRFSCQKLVNLADNSASNENFCSHFIPSSAPIGQNQIDNAIGIYNRGLYWRADQFTDVTAMKNYLLAQYNANTPVMYVAKLATPIEITTTPETVSSISGDNNIFIDTGNMTEIAYFENAEDNLIKLIKACQI